MTTAAVGESGGRLREWRGGYGDLHHFLHVSGALDPPPVPPALSHVYLESCLSEELPCEDGLGWGRIEGFLLDDDPHLLLEVEGGKLQGGIFPDPVHHDLGVHQLVSLWGLDEVLVVSR